VIVTALAILFGFLALALGVVGLIAPALPGPPLIYLGILTLAWADGFRRLDPLELTFLGLVAVFVTVLDVLAGIYGTKWFGGTRWGMFGASVGLLLGLPFGLAGLLIGPFAGVLVFEYWKSPDLRAAIRAGTGSVLGFLVGTSMKVALSIGMMGLALWWAVRP